MSVVVLPRPGNMVMIGQQTLHEELSIDIMQQLKVNVQEGGIFKIRKNIKTPRENATMTLEPVERKNTRWGVIRSAVADVVKNGIQEESVLISRQ